jgi:hypothetical protein
LEIAMDGAGAAHVVATNEEGVIYLSNRSGSWTRQRITSPPPGGYDGNLSLGVDRDGSLTLALTRFGDWFCFGIGCVAQEPAGIYLMSGDGRAWSEPSAIAEGPNWESSLAVDGGPAHIAFARQDNKGGSSIHYGTNAGGSWSVEQVAVAAYEPHLELAPDGTARLAFVEETGSAVYLTAASGTGTFSVETLPGGSSTFALDAAGRPHVITGSSHFTHDGSSWTEPMAVFEPARLEYGDGEFDEVVVHAGAIDVRNGTVHVISSNDYSSGAGVWYANNATGPFMPVQLWAADGFVEDGPSGSSGIAVDASGRAHAVFTKPDGGIWYAGPPSQ